MDIKRNDLIQQLVDRHGYTKKAATSIVDDFVDIVLENLPDKYYVAASGMAGIGNANDIRTRKITDKFYLCGDGVSDISDGIGLVAPRVAICAAHQAHTVLRILAKEFDV